MLMLMVGGGGGRRRGGCGALLGSRNLSLISDKKCTNLSHHLILNS